MPALHTPPTQRLESMVVNGGRFHRPLSLFLTSLAAIYRRLGSTHTGKSYGDRLADWGAASGGRDLALTDVVSLLGETLRWPGDAGAFPPLHQVDDFRLVNVM